MITRDNIGIYQDLFKKANMALNYIDAEGQVLKPDDIITNIDDYFTCIKTLAEYEEREGTDPIFTILPVDEGTFNIDANTRKIEIPTEFMTSGIAVKGDEIAETLYFTIDRYFDVTDLYYKDILVQWKNANGDEGLSLTYNKSLSYKPGYVTFGWPITSEITKAAGPVQFSVRFYDRFEDDSSSYLTYSFSTLTATVKVNPALDFDISDEDAITATIVDKSKMIFDNIKNSAATGITTPAAKPVFEEDWILAESINLDDIKTTILINGIETAVLETKAHVPENILTGIGEISYNWVQKDAQGNNVEETLVQGYGYKETSDIKRNANDVYYYLRDGKYELYNGDLPAEEGVTIYERYSYCVPKTAGLYIVTATNTSGRGNYSSIEDDCLIPFAQQAIFVLEDKSIILEDNLNEDGTVKPIVYEVTTPDNGTLTYKWKYYSGYGKNDNDYSKAVILEDQTSNSIEITEKGHYYLIATNTKNNNSLDTISPAIRVTNRAIAPTISNYLADGTIQSIQDNTVYVSVNAEISCDAKVNSTDFDEILYQWQKRNSETKKYENIIGETNIAYKVTESGIYKCIITNRYNEDEASVASLPFNAE